MFDLLFHFYERVLIKMSLGMNYRQICKTYVPKFKVCSLLQKTHLHYHTLHFHITNILTPILFNLINSIAFFGR